MAEHQTSMTTDWKKMPGSSYFHELELVARTGQLERKEFQPQSHNSSTIAAPRPRVYTAHVSRSSKVVYAVLMVAEQGRSFLCVGND